ARDDLSDILHRETAGRVPTRGILEHLDAERAFRCDDRGTRCARFTHANDSGLLLARDAIPVLGTARATAEAPLPIPRHLDDLEARNGLERISRSVEDPVVAADVTRIVDGNARHRRAVEV